MLEWLASGLRTRSRDQVEALRAVKAASDRDLRHALADYDAFVPHARSIKEGLLVGTGETSSGERVPVRVPWNEEFCHWLVQGGTGTGKTTWIASILRQELAAERAFGVLDCKGDLFEAAIQWTAALSCTMPPDRREALRRRLVVVNPFADALVPLNVCRPLPGVSAEAQAYEITLALSRLFDTSLGPHMESILRHLVLLLVESRLSLVEAPQILQDDVLRGLLAARSTNPIVKDFFLGTWSSVPQVSKDALLSRLQGLLLPENVRLMLGGESLLDLKGVLERGDPLFIFLGKGPGVPEEQVDVLGSLLLQLILQATYARGSGARRGYLLALDEFVHLLDAPAVYRRVETALTTVRSFGLSLMLIHHNFAQLSAGLRETALGNCDLIAVFRTSSANARFFGDFLPETDPDLVASLRSGSDRALSREDARRRQLETLQRLPNRMLFWYDRRQPYRAIRLGVADLPAPHEVAGLSRVQLETLIHNEGWDRGDATVPRARLRAEIEERSLRLRDLMSPPIVVPRASADPLRTRPGAKARPRIG